MENALYTELSMFPIYLLPGHKKRGNAFHDYIQGRTLESPGAEPPYLLLLTIALFVK